MLIRSFFLVILACSVALGLVKRGFHPVVRTTLSQKAIQANLIKPFSSFRLWAADPERRITRSAESGKDYFESDFDRTPIKDRLPVALGVLFGVSLPFIVGLIYLYSSK
jgi:hypothetical protein